MPFLFATILTTVIALTVETCFGYPARIFAAIGHPVTWLGAMIARLERQLNCLDLPATVRRRRGVLAIGVALLVAIGIALLLEAATMSLLQDAGFLVIGVLASSLIAQRSLYRHVAQVATGLMTDLHGGRLAIAHIVGRDPQSLDEAAVARAAIESLAENFSDGVVAPVFYMVVGGLPAAVAYKTINTADSMIGHRSPRYEAYGWAAARLDDLVNLPASRLSALFIVAAAALLPGYNAAEAARAVLRDAAHHRSPNAGWAEAAMAGALGLRLAGPRSYGGVVVADSWMGRGRTEAEPADILAALRLYRMTCALQAAAIALLLLSFL